jgi:CBS-domain-containing membrane protein
MLREYDIGVLLVVDELSGRKLMGVVTDRDLCLTGLAEEHDPTLTSVEDCMATQVETCTPDTDVRAAVAAMTEHRVRRMPVVDRDNNVLGILGISDLIEHHAVSAEEIWRLLSRVTGTRHLARAQAA